MKHSNVHYSRSMTATASKICTELRSTASFSSFQKKYIRNIEGRYIPGASKNKPFWKSNIEAAIFYLCSTKFLYYLCNALYYCKKKVTVILPLRNRIFHKNFVMIITLDNTSSNKWASDLRVNLIYQCFKVN